MGVERKHGYGADFSVRHRTASPCAGPVMNVERKHNFADQGHRSLRARSNTPTMDVKRAHQYQGERAIKSDLSSMVGPIYNSGKATKHNFSGGHGYVAPKGARLINKNLLTNSSQRSQSNQNLLNVLSQKLFRFNRRLSQRLNFQVEKIEGRKL